MRIKYLQKTLAKYTKIKDPHPKYTQNSKFSNKKTNNPIKKEVKDLNRHLTKEDI